MKETKSLGKRLVAEHRAKVRRDIKQYVLAALVGTVVGLSIGFTVSDFWSLLIDRCSACGELGSEKEHKELGSLVAPNYYVCQPRPPIYRPAPPSPYLDR